MNELDSAPPAQIETVDHQAGQEQQRRQIVGHPGTDGKGEIHCAVSGSEVINHRRHKHVQQPPADLAPFSGVGAVSRGDFRERLAALSAGAQITRRRTPKDSPAFHSLKGAIAAYGKTLALLTALQQREEFYTLIAQCEFAGRVGAVS